MAAAPSGRATQKGTRCVSNDVTARNRPGHDRIVSAACDTDSVSPALLQREMYTDTAAARLLRVARSTLHWWLAGDFHDQVERYQGADHQPRALHHPRIPNRYDPDLAGYSPGRAASRRWRRVLGRVGGA